MVEIFRNKWCEDLDELLKCTVCMNCTSTKFHQCVQGHLICLECKNQIPICPKCNQRWSSARNLLAEHLCSKLENMKESLIHPDAELNKLLIPDTVSIACQTEGTAFEAAKKGHQGPQGPFPCRIGACNTILYFTSLINHIQTEHPHEFLELQQDSNVFQHNWIFEYTEQMMFDRAFRITDVGAFFLKLSTDVFGNFTGFVLMVENAAQSRKYSYQLELNCCAEHSCPVYTGEVISCRTSVGAPPEKCLHIKRAEMRRLIHREKALKCTLLLVKKAAAEVEKQAQPTQTKKYPKKRSNSARPPEANRQSEPRPGPSYQHAPDNVRQSRSISRSNGFVNFRPTTPSPLDSSDDEPGDGFFD